MTTFDLNVDPKLRRNLAKANAAFSKIEYPSAVEVIDILVRHRIAVLLEQWSHLIQAGDMTLKTVLLNWLNTEFGDFVVILDGFEIYGLGFQLHDDGNWPAGYWRLKEVLDVVKDSLSSLGLLSVLESIGIRVAASQGSKPEHDVIIFESI